MPHAAFAASGGSLLLHVFNDDILSRQRLEQLILAELSHVRNMKPGVLSIVIHFHAVLVYPRQTLQCLVCTGHSGARSGHGDMDGHVGGAGAGHGAFELLFGNALLAVALVAADEDNPDQQADRRGSGLQAHETLLWINATG